MAVSSRSGAEVPAELCSPGARALWSSRRRSLTALCKPNISWPGRELLRGWVTPRESKGKGRSMQRVKGALPTQHTLCANPPSHVFEILAAIS